MENRTTTIDKSQFAAIILAGGRSSRMKQPKALLRLGSMTLVEKAICSVAPFVAKIIVMLSPSQKEPDITVDLPCKLQFHRDHIAFQGPLQGIADAFPLLGTQDKIIVTTCDMPYLTEEWIFHLVHSTEDNFDAIVSFSQGIRNPLLAVYQKKALMTVFDLLQSNVSKAQSLLFNKRLLLLDPEEKELDTLFTIKDANSPEEYRKALCHFGFCEASQTKITVELKGELKEKAGYGIFPIFADNLTKALQIISQICPPISQELESFIQNIKLCHLTLENGTPIKTPMYQFQYEDHLIVEECLQL